MPKATFSKARSGCSLRFDPVSLDSFFQVLDAIAWIGEASAKQINQFGNIDPRTGGKVLKNGLTLGIVESVDGEYSLRLPYPYKGSLDEKKAVLRESFLKMPLMVHLRQFLKLGDGHPAALRKAATLTGVENYDEGALAPLLKWARELGVTNPESTVEDLVEEALEVKQERHEKHASKVVAFLSHSSKDKAFVRQLAADLARAGIDVWLDEQRILVGDSIAEKIGQGLAQSDFFVIALSENSVGSTWVQKELNNALIQEVERREVTVLPIKLSECEIPPLLRDKKYADFSKSYKDGLQDLINTMTQRKNL
jgi:hypothetical protein